ncbi:helix-turn-helix transcriptional regulator [Maridesulfovibrio sp.]|uniref:helix-turn-helix transcriptional regulator n=1 Tax=unclassified Maridesulfovibrio TaxID=2794999 RepID=UPI003B0018CB
MNENYEPKGPYISAKAAAEYAGYSYDHFRQLVKKYRIPRRGPSKVRFALSDLDEWMLNPNFFCEVPVASKRKRKFKTVKIKGG